MSIINTPFGPQDPNDRSKVTDPSEPQPVIYATDDPYVAFNNAADPVDDPAAYREHGRVRRVAVELGGVVVAHADWRKLDNLTYQEQIDLALDGLRLRHMALPWFTARFSIEDVGTIKSVFPHRSVWYQGNEIFL